MSQIILQKVSLLHDRPPTTYYFVFLLLLISGGCATTSLQKREPGHTQAEKKGETYSAVLDDRETNQKIISLPREPSERHIAIGLDMVVNKEYLKAVPVLKSGLKWLDSDPSYQALTDSLVTSESQNISKLIECIGNCDRAGVFTFQSDNPNAPMLRSSLETLAVVIRSIDARRRRLLGKNVEAPQTSSLPNNSAALENLELNERNNSLPREASEKHIAVGLDMVLSKQYLKAVPILELGLKWLNSDPDYQASTDNLVRGEGDRLSQLIESIQMEDKLSKLKEKDAGELRAMFPTLTEGLARQLKTIDDRRRSLR